MLYVLIAVKRFTAGMVANIVHISATLKKGLGTIMIRRMLRLEARFQIIMIMMRSLLRQGIINEREYREAEDLMVKRYRPASRTLFSDLVFG